MVPVSALVNPAGRFWSLETAHLNPLPGGRGHAAPGEGELKTLVLFLEQLLVIPVYQTVWLVS